MKHIKTLIKTHQKQIITYVITFICLLLLCRANIIGVISPFGYSAVFALLLLNKNGFILGLEYFFCAILYDFSFKGLISACSVLSTVLVLYLVYKILKKKIPFAVCLIFSLISQAGFVYFNVETTEQIVKTIISVTVGLCFVYIFYVAFKSAFFKGIQSKYSLDESICLAILILFLFCGLSSIYIYNVNISISFVCLVLLVVSKSFSKNLTLYLSALAGIGFAFFTSSLVFMAIFVSFAIIATVMVENSRIFTCILILLCDSLFGLFFNAYAVYNVFNVIPLVVVLLVYLALPNKLFYYIRNLSFNYEGSLINDFLIVGERETIKNRLISISSLFRQMQTEYQNLSIGEADRKTACEMLANKVVSSFCSSCLKRNYCRENSNIKQSVLKLFEFGMEKGKVTIIDASNLLTESCVSLSALISEINSALKLYFEYEKTVKNSDQGKILASEQMGGTAEIFSEFANKNFKTLKFDKKRAKEVIDELAENKIVANECVVLCDESGVKKVVLVVRNNDVLSPELSSSLSSVFNLNFDVKERKMAKYSGWTIISFVPSDKYVLSIGFAKQSANENTASGDTSSIVKISENKYLFALSDGMGHGEKANKISTSALSLIESFYKAGFSNETIISSVNKILLPSGEDNFVTLDACVVDLSLGVADFIKVGASISVIKSQNQTEMIVTDSLPLGITNISCPKVVSRVLKQQDIIVIASDGIVDSFDRVEEYVNFVNNENCTNLQLLAETILEEALSRTVHKDDMTVIAIKLNIKV